MLKVKHHSNPKKICSKWGPALLATFFFLSCLGLSPNSFAESSGFKKNETGLYRETFDQNLYHEGVNQLDLGRWGRKIFNKKIRATNVNIFDEVPDSSFFTNRHAKDSLSRQKLQDGYRETSNMDTSGDLLITKGKVAGLHPGFFVKDARGDAYLLKFDAADYLELATGAEVIASRFYYALGYHVPQYTVANFSPDQLRVTDSATFYDDSGFKKKLTEDRLEEILFFVPITREGKYRASASKILAGKNKGVFSFRGKRRGDPEDGIHHRDRREMRALQVFSSWLNNYDTRSGNTLDMLVTENGQTFLRHYLIDFNSSLGASAKGPKPPMFGHEYAGDYGETFKAFLSLGWWKKPWQKRWEENHEDASRSPAIGYFDNHQFKPENFKTQLPYEAFREITRADGFWAAKIMMKFSDADILSMVQAGELSRSEDVDYLTEILIERRDLIARYWFSVSSPLDQFRYSGGTVSFEDLAISYDFESLAGTAYHVEVKNSQGKKIETFESTQNSFSINPSWLQENDLVDVMIRVARQASSKLHPYVRITLDSSGIQGIQHQD